MPTAKKSSGAKKGAAKKSSAKSASKSTAKKGAAKKGAAKGGAKKATAAKKGAASKGGAAKKSAAKGGGSKTASAAKKSGGTKRALNPALSAPMNVSPELGAVVGNQPMPRSEITKRIWDYIKKNGLQDQVNRRAINADDKLRPIFGGKNQVSMFEMTALVNKHMRPA
jgi:chromatin remodeling complex protein RSC6